MHFFKQSNVYAEQLEKEIEICMKRISELPQGHLSYVRKRSSFIYKLCPGTGHSKYIPVGQLAFAAKLAEKDLMEQKLLDAQNELAAINAYRNRHRESYYIQFLNSHEGHRVLLEQSGILFNREVFNDDEKKPHLIRLNLLKDPIWRDKVSSDPLASFLLESHIVVKNDKIYWNYNGSNGAKNQNYRDKPTACGVMVRSKSEVIIADKLFYKGYLFLYEPELIINGHSIYPDFVIFHPLTGQIFILEHLGLLFDAAAQYTPDEQKKAIEYTNNFLNKLALYQFNGWTLGINLLTTSETKNHSFDSTTLDSLIEQYLSY